MAVNDNSGATTGANISRALNLRWLRPAVQSLFAVVIILIGIEFGAFVKSLSGPSTEAVASRPPSVEGFLPISSLMSLVYLVKSGVANRIHPAGLVIFSLTLFLALALRRGFCSWACPIGFASEWAHKLGKWIFSRNPRIPIWLDVPLQGLKYFLLGFFAYHILRMPLQGLESFIHSPYNRMADVKMYLFFSNISRTALVVIFVLLALSVVFKNFWCRYLCPYGALLGLVSLASPTAVSRDAEKCVGCGKCAVACPNMINVDKKTRVNTPECMACYSCVDACRVKNALRVRATLVPKPISATVYGFITVAAFIVASNAASAFNFWRPETTPEMYRQLNAIVGNIGHPGVGGLPSKMPEDLPAHHYDLPEFQERFPDKPQGLPPHHYDPPQLNDGGDKPAPGAQEESPNIF
jgi:polyferredoxin